MPGLKIECSYARGDTFEAADGAGVCGFPTVWLHMKDRNTMRYQATHLNTDDARELFNWLGVWLHGGNRGEE